MLTSDIVHRENEGRGKKCNLRGYVEYIRVDSGYEEIMAVEVKAAFNREFFHRVTILRKNLSEWKSPNEH